MKWFRISAIARKETLHVLRDWRSLLMALGTPIFLLMLFGYALTLDVTNVPLIVWDQSQTPQSRALISDFTGSRYFSLAGHARDYEQIENAIDKREAFVALVVPQRFAENLSSGKPEKIQLIIDGSDANTATISLGYADAVLQRFAQNVLWEYFNQKGQKILPQPIDLRTRVWYNSELISTNNIIPSLIAVIMMVVSALLTSLTVSREWERGTMEQLIATPIQVPELIIGKMLPFFAIGILDVISVVLVGYFVFHVPIQGSLLLLLAFSVVFLIGSLSLGMLISISTKSQLIASQLAIVATFLPSVLLSGFITAIPNMPAPIQWISYGIPARYFVSVLKAIYLKGVGIQFLYLEAIFLIVFSIVLFLSTNLKFKKKL